MFLSGGSDEVDGRKIQERRRHLTLKTLFIKDVKPSLQVQRLMVERDACDTSKQEKEKKQQGSM
ncbi:unnamed protein product [Brassica oleracea]